MRKKWLSQAPFSSHNTNISSKQFTTSLFPTPRFHLHLPKQTHITTCQTFSSYKLNSTHRKSDDLLNLFSEESSMQSQHFPHFQQEKWWEKLWKWHSHKSWAYIKYHPLSSMYLLLHTLSVPSTSDWVITHTLLSSHSHRLGSKRKERHKFSAFTG